MGLGGGVVELEAIKDGEFAISGVLETLWVAMLTAESINIAAT